MNTEELRIGNRVRYNGRIIIVKNITAKGINLEFDKKTFAVINWIPVNDIEPVILDSKIIHRLGFEYLHQKAFLFRKHIPSLYLIRKLDTFYLSVKQEHIEIASFKYVHELQNLMFDLWRIKLYK